MPRALMHRLDKLETARAAPPSYFVQLPHDAWDHGDEHLAAVTAEAIRDHQRRTGYMGPVLVGPPECATAEEWMQRYGRADG